MLFRWLFLGIQSQYTLKILFTDVLKLVPSSWLSIQSQRFGRCSLKPSSDACCSQ